MQYIYCHLNVSNIIFKLLMELKLYAMCIAHANHSGAENSTVYDVLVPYVT